MGRAGRDGERNSGSEDDALRGPVALVAALLGLVVAAIGVFLGSWLGNPYLDGGASIVIGLILMTVGVLLARETLSLLVGESPPPETMASLRKMALAEPAVARVGQAMAVHFGPEEVALNLELFFRPDQSMSEVAAAINRVERRIRAAHPESAMSSSAPRRSQSPPAQGPSFRSPEESVGDAAGALPWRTGIARSVTGERPRIRCVAGAAVTSASTLDGADAIGDDDLVVGSAGTTNTSARFCAAVTPGRV